MSPCMFWERLYEIHYHPLKGHANGGKRKERGGCSLLEEGVLALRALLAEVSYFCLNARPLWVRVD